MPKRSRRREDEESLPPFDFQVFRQNLRRLRENLGLNIRERLRGFFQPQEERELRHVAIPERERPQEGLARPERDFEIEKTYDYSKGCWIYCYKDPTTGRIVRVEEIYEPQESEVSEEDEGVSPRILRRRRVAPRVIDSIRMVFNESARQVALKTRLQELQVKRLEKELEEREHQSKRREEEARGVHW